MRILFCLFAEDTGIFERDAFQLYLENRTKEDGSDLGAQLARLFDVLDTSPEKRQKNLDESLGAFPYVNGALFAENLGFADLNRDMRNALLASTRFDWSRISPAVFGSLFQAVMQPRERRQIGGHYTSERDILKVARALFLDDLWEEFKRVKKNKPELRRFHQKIAKLRFLDPACGCGNFLVVTYRELRGLEIEVLRALYGEEQQELDIQHLSQVDVDAFYGIEISEWPARIAEVAMWLMDHQMNIRLSEAFGQYFVRLPLKKRPTIVCQNALRLDWRTVLPPEECSYVLGNPPFVGAKFQTDAQRADMDFVTGKLKNAGLLDFVSGWYFRAAGYIQGTKIVVGFVSTNSITQGEQVAPLWQPLLDRYHISIHFAHRTFPWQSEARGKAHVHVIIIGFANYDRSVKHIYEYDPKGERATTIEVKNISPYLIDGSNTMIANRSTPLCNVMELGIGNKPIDGGYYLFTPAEKAEFLKLEPKAGEYFKRWIGAEEFINGIDRWCLWLGECPPDELRQMPEAMKRVDAVKAFRLASKSAPTRKIAATPTRFHVTNMPTERFLAIPEVSSEHRPYIPIGFLNPDVICSNKLRILPCATVYQFGVLSSAIHMAWVRQVTGRMKSDFQYSVKLVYNSFPWPESPTDKQKAAVDKAAQAVLDARTEFPDATLADLYDPLSMPPKLVKAHEELDRAVDLCYRPHLSAASASGWSSSLLFMKNSPLRW